jgi:phosphate transport system substrate-binding protein
LVLPQEAKVLTSTVVAKDGISIIIHPQNPIGALTADQARNIFNGKIINWKDVGGSDATIRVISREEGSGTRSTFDKLVLQDDKLLQGALFQNSNGTIREAVANDVNAIGYISMGLVNGAVKALNYDNVAPFEKNVKNGTYPLARPIFFLTKEMNPNLQAFIDYVLSEEGQGILNKEGLTTVR